MEMEIRDINNELVELPYTSEYGAEQLHMITTKGEEIIIIDDGYGDYTVYFDGKEEEMDRDQVTELIKTTKHFFTDVW